MPQGYNPGYQEEQFSPYGAPPSFPNEMFGNPSPSQRFFQDSRNRGMQYLPGQGFAPAGGIDMSQFGLLGAFANMALQRSMGGFPIRPFNGYEGGDSDFLESNARSRAMRDNMSAELNKGGALGNSELGKSSLAQTLQEMAGTTYGGSSYQASNILASRQGRSLSNSTDPADQYRAATSAVDQMRRQFGVGGFGDSEEPGYIAPVHSYTRSFGFNLQESANNLDSGIRYGNVSGGRQGLADAVRNGEIGEMTAAQNAKVRMGKQAFGQNTSADQINQLLDSAMGGLANVTPEKATAFLAKIQTTARAMDINAKAFTEYVAMQQGVYKQMGLGGAASADSIIGAALSGQAVMDAAQSKGGIGGLNANKDVAMAATAAIEAESQGSNLYNQARAVGAIYDNLSPAQRAAVKTANGVSVSTQMRKVEALLNEGKSDEAEAIIRDIKGVSGFEMTDSLANNMNSDIAAKGNRHIRPNGQGASFSVREDHVNQIFARMGGPNASIKSSADLGSMLANVKDFGSQKEIEKALVAGGVSPAEAAALSGQMATSSVDIQSHMTGDGERAIFQAQANETSVDGIARREATRAKQTKESNVALVLNRRMGAIGKELGVEDLVKFTKDFIDAGGVKGGEDAARAALKKSGIAIDSKKLAGLMESMKPGGELDQVSDKAERAYADALVEGKSYEEADAAKAEVLAQAGLLNDNDQTAVDDAAKAAEDKKNRSEANGTDVLLDPLKEMIDLLAKILYAILHGTEMPVSTVVPQ